MFDFDVAHRSCSRFKDFNFSNNQTLTDFMKEELNNELFDFVREDEEFKQIVEQLNKA